MAARACAVDLQLDGVTGGDLESWARSRCGLCLPLGEEFERDVVQIRNAAGVRPAGRGSTPEFIYTAAMQAADFGGPVCLLCREISLYGAGTFATVNSVVGGIRLGTR